MSVGKKLLATYVDLDVKDAFKKLAKQEKRSVNGMLAFLVEQKLRATLFLPSGDNHPEPGTPPPASPKRRAA